MHIRSWLLLAAFAVAGTAAAQDYPAKPVKVIVPWSAGGGADTVARLISAKLSESLGQTFFVENRGGATGTIGTDMVAKSAPDGYTLLLGTNSTYVLAVGLYKKLPYDTDKDLTPISRVAEVPHILSVNPNVPVKSAEELIALLKANPGKYSFGSSGTASTPQVAGQVFMNRTGTKLLHVPYKGSGQSVADTVSGTLQVSFDTLPAVLPFIQSGRLKALAVLGPKRVSALPDLPTTAELGLAGAEGQTWFGLYGPANLPAPIVTRMAAAIEQALADPTTATRFNDMGTPPMRGWTPQRFATYVADEVVAWAPLVRASGARVE